MMTLKVRQIEAFRAVMITGSVTAASDLLAISQPSASRLIADLEQATGLPLFVRDKRRLTPTPEALLLLEEVDRLFLGLDTITERVRQIRDRGSGQLRLACLPTFSSSFLPKVVKSFAAEHPDVALTVVTRGSGVVVDWVADRRVDFGIAIRPTDLPGVESELLIDTALVCAMPAGHRLARKKVIEPHDLDGEDFIGLNDDRLSWDRADQILGEAGVRPKIRVTTQRAYVAYGLVAEGLGVALIEPFTAPLFYDRGVVARPFRPRIPLQFHLFFPIARPRSAMVRSFCGYLTHHVREHARGLPGG